MIYSCIYIFQNYQNRIGFSIATPLLDQGTNLRIIQECFGHKLIKIKEMYTHVSGASLKDIKNPIEDMDL